MRREISRVLTDERYIEPAQEWLAHFVKKGLQGGPVRISIGRPRRSLDQNAKLWPMLTDVSRQVEWYGRYLPQHVWKHIFTAALKEQETYPGLNGGFVVCGYETSKMTVAELSDLIELIYAFGAEHGVIWSEPDER